MMGTGPGRSVGSLLLGAYDEPSRLVHVGQVRTGFTHRALDPPRAKGEPLARADSPFDLPVRREHAHHAHLVEPTLVGELAYRILAPCGRLGPLVPRAAPGSDAAGRGPPAATALAVRAVGSIPHATLPAQVFAGLPPRR